MRIELQHNEPGTSTSAGKDRKYFILDPTSLLTLLEVQCISDIVSVLAASHKLMLYSLGGK
jgi:hypothetical protein